jgi:hypothetical protein
MEIKMKFTLTLIAGVMFLVMPCFAENYTDTNPSVVRGEGEADIQLPNALILAKEAATQDAESKCHSPVEVVESLGWEIQETDDQPTCIPHHFCGDEPTRLLAKAIFLCKKGSN